jgi:hypothetical protein
MHDIQVSEINDDKEKRIALLGILSLWYMPIQDGQMQKRKKERKNAKRIKKTFKTVEMNKSKRHKKRKSWKKKIAEHPVNDASTGRSQDNPS